MVARTKRRWHRVSESKRREVIRLAAKGLSQRAITEKLKLAKGSVWRVVRPLGGVIRPEMWAVSEGRLSLDDRVEIRLGLGPLPAQRSSGP